MISILPNFVLNSNLHSLRARQIRVRHAGKASKYKSKPYCSKGLQGKKNELRCKSLLSWTSNIFLKPRPFPSHLMEYHGRIKKWFESLNNIYSEQCLPYLTDFFPRGFIIFVYAFAIWEAQAIHNPAATRARSISKCRSHANLRVTWEITSWNLRFLYMNLESRFFGNALYNEKCAPSWLGCSKQKRQWTLENEGSKVKHPTITMILQEIIWYL